jgi:2-dehydropantoate 2-reductase
VIAVLGPGGVGAFLAAALARAGVPVTVVARESTAGVIAARGIAVRSVRLGDFAVPVPAVSELAAPVETLVVATKSVGLAGALERVRAVPALVVPLLNGLDHMVVLRARFGAERVAAGAIRIEADRLEPGVVVQTSPFLRIDLAADRPAPRARLPELAATLERAQVPTAIERSESQALWSKLVRLNALATTTSASGRTIGFIRADPAWRARLRDCIWEAAAVANADGAAIDPADRLAELDAAHPGLGSSMQRDIAAGREPELDAIAGAVLRAGDRHGVPCPTIAGLAAEIAAKAGVARPWPQASE